MNEQEVSFLTEGDKLVPAINEFRNGFDFKLVEYMIFKRVLSPKIGNIMLKVKCYKYKNHDNGASWGLYDLRAVDMKPVKQDPDRYDIFECK